jgi:hypothetical protein
MRTDCILLILPLLSSGRIISGLKPIQLSTHSSSIISPVRTIVRNLSYFAKIRTQRTINNIPLFIVIHSSINQAKMTYLDLNVGSIRQYYGKFFLNGGPILSINFIAIFDSLCLFFRPSTPNSSIISDFGILP